MPSGAPQADRPINNDISVGPTSGASHYYYSGPPRKSAPGEAVITELPGVSDYGGEGGGPSKLHPDQERQNLQEL
jgi:hypothetical protein